MFDWKPMSKDTATE